MTNMSAEGLHAKLTARFCEDIRSLLKRHRIPCAGAQDLQGLGETLFTEGGFRSDLFSLCNSISHMADRDLTADELLNLVAESYGPGLVVSAENRAAFLSAYQGWHARELAVEIPTRSIAETPAEMLPAVAMSAMDETLQRISESSLELKLFLADVKQRVTEIDPELQHLEQMIAQMKLATSTSAQSTQSAVALPTNGTEGGRVRRLRVAVGVLAAALVLALGGVGWVAHQTPGRELAPATIVNGDAQSLAGTTSNVKGMANEGKASLPAGHAGDRRAMRGLAPLARAKSTNVLREGDRTRVARLPAPIVRRDTVTRAETAAAPVYVPASTMIGYALASPKPMYPAVSVPDDKTSRVEVQATISPRGDVVATKVLSGPVIFREAAEHALKGWRFRPYLVDGSAVEVSTTVAFVFRSMPAT